MRSALRPVRLLTIAALAACGNPGETPAVAEPGGGGATDSLAIAGEAGAPEFTPVELPATFPAAFPLPPGGTVTEAGEGRGLSTIEVAAPGDAAAQAAWYATALTEAGWDLAGSEPAGLEAGVDRPWSIHATRGESYADLTLEPHPAAPGWVRTRASIWSVEP
ncbi:MAG: hypothetical protein ABR559_00095 [Gemmatimonadota bacterium]